jgi:hypothetical protein
MRDDDYPPLLARRLRDNMRADRGLADDCDEPSVASADLHSDSEIDPDSDANVASRERSRRWRRSRNEVSDSVQIEGDDGHAWWAGREMLDNVVDPKKHAAAKRARRAAEAAFAPEGTTVRPDPTRAPRTQDSADSGTRWSPDDVFSWTSADHATTTGPERPQQASEPDYPETPWQVLGLTSDASWREVTRRHRHLALEHHPDRHGASDAEQRVQAESRMSDINAAFSELRRIYQLTDGV